MIADRSGSLSGIKRHDYLPFGEELYAGTGGRTTQQGYAADGVRQQFTGKERDNETGLDYFLARYYSSIQGRFTSPDPLLASGRSEKPQSWNRYNYVLNNPLRLVDPSGMIDNDPPKPKVVVVIFEGGHPITNSVSGSNTTSSNAVTEMRAGGKIEGFGESSLDAEGPNIGQQIKNDFPDARVIVAGPSAQPQIFNDLATNKPDNIIIEGYSNGAFSAVALTNNLTRNGQRVDNLTTVDPSCGCPQDPTIRNPEMVGDAVNYTEYPTRDSPVNGARNVYIGTNDRDPNRQTPIEHQTLDDITAPRVVRGIEGTLQNIYGTQGRRPDE